MTRPFSQDAPSASSAPALPASPGNNKLPIPEAMGWASGSWVLESQRALIREQCALESSCPPSPSASTPARRPLRCCTIVRRPRLAIGCGVARLQRPSRQRLAATTGVLSQPRRHVWSACRPSPDRPRASDPAGADRDAHCTLHPSHTSGGVLRPLHAPRGRAHRASGRGAAQTRAPPVLDPADIALRFCPSPELCYNKPFKIALQCCPRRDCTRRAKTTTTTRLPLHCPRATPTSVPSRIAV
jgi:hypothetical protein